MTRILRENEAFDFYTELLKIFAEDVSLKCKMFLLRYILENIIERLVQVIGHNNKTNKNLKVKDGKFIEIIDIIFQSKDKNVYADNLKKDIIDTKRLLNENVHETSFVSGEDLKKHLKRILDLINYFSGVPIPSKLQVASKILEKVEIKRQLDVIILNELFDQTNSFGYGATMYNKLLSMIREKDLLGFGKVNFHLITYMPSALHVSSTKDSATIIGDNGVNKALDKAINLVNERISKFRKKETGSAFKPMMLWLCNSIPESIDKALMNKLVSLSNGEDGKNFSFTPVVIHKIGIEQFKAYNKKWVPKVLIPQLIENFIFSLLLSIQRADLKKQNLE